MQTVLINMTEVCLLMPHCLFIILNHPSMSLKSNGHICGDGVIWPARAACLDVAQAVSGSQSPVWPMAVTNDHIVLLWIFALAVLGSVVVGTVHVTLVIWTILISKKMLLASCAVPISVYVPHIQFSTQLSNTE